MPTSNLSVWPYILNAIWSLHPNVVLDVGPGWGKAGLLLREYVDPNIQVDAVELWEPYITPRLRSLYENVYHDDVVSWQSEQFNPYDLILLGDVIEHIEKEAGKQLLERIQPAMVVCTPVEFFESIDYPPTELHISHWTMEDFTSIGASVNQEALAMGALVATIPEKNGRR